MTPLNFHTYFALPNIRKGETHFLYLSPTKLSWKICIYRLFSKPRLAWQGITRILIKWNLKNLGICDTSHNLPHKQSFQKRHSLSQLSNMQWGLPADKLYRTSHLLSHFAKSGMSACSHDLLIPDSFFPFGSAVY